MAEESPNTEQQEGGGMDMDQMILQHTATVGIKCMLTIYIKNITLL